ncbi:SpoIIE family protein phosphatase [Metabacillus litoralis]|uniref:SpoIIE family protein phosphatase n=1 Tax=Metabacillus litoralis TaxID=152268 RepID=A0A5C6W4U5_9BACI|nr:SpoIIE family protein phosphatase [Metabacillus litoralis]TXC92967.1 SpoIIE family protein phosphatase [Metabacillus litoralis]
MEDQLNHAPFGFMTLSEDGLILSINKTLLDILNFSQEQLIEKHVNDIFTVPTKLFYQFYVIPLIKVNKKVEEMYITLKSFGNNEVPVIMNAKFRTSDNKSSIDFALIPIQKRSEYENELLTAKKDAESALHAKHKANAELKIALEHLKAKQEELIELNNQNHQYKVDTITKLEFARKIQETSLADSIQNEHIQIESYYRASSELSGDMYGFYRIDQDRYGIIILDVMGHGVSSALITMSLHSLFQRLISFGNSTEMVMQELDNHLHRLFHNNEDARHYCTAIYLLINTASQQIEFINAGHPPALLQKKDGQQLELNTTSLPLGIFESTKFKAKSFTYNKGDRILLYTDGVTDPLGFNHLKPLLLINKDLPNTRLKELIVHSLNNEQNLQHKSDDQCFLIVDVN